MTKGQRQGIMLLGIMGLALFVLCRSIGIRTHDATEDTYNAPPVTVVRGILDAASDREDEHWAKRFELADKVDALQRELHEIKNAPPIEVLRVESDGTVVLSEALLSTNGPMTSVVLQRLDGTLLTLWERCQVIPRLGVDVGL